MACALFAMDSNSGNSTKWTHTHTHTSTGYWTMALHIILCIQATLCCYWTFFESEHCTSYGRHMGAREREIMGKRLCNPTNKESKCRKHTHTQTHIHNSWNCAVIFVYLIAFTLRLTVWETKSQNNTNGIVYGYTFTLQMHFNAGKCMFFLFIVRCIFHSLHSITWLHLCSNQLKLCWRRRQQHRWRKSNVDRCLSYISHHHRCNNIRTNCQHMFEIQNEHTNKTCTLLFFFVRRRLLHPSQMVNMFHSLKSLFDALFLFFCLMCCSFASYNFSRAHKRTHTHRPNVPNFIFKMLFYSHFLFVLLFLISPPSSSLSLRLFLWFVVDAFSFSLSLSPSLRPLPFHQHELFFSLLRFHFVCVSMSWTIWWFFFSSHFKFTISLWNGIKSFYYHVCIDVRSA